MIRHQQKRAVHTLWILILGVLCAAPITEAQNPEQSWDNLRNLLAGQRIEVVDQALRSRQGAFVAMSEEALSMRDGQTEIAIQRADVFRVSAVEPSKRKRNVLIGFLIGAGLGGTAGALGSDDNASMVTGGVVNGAIFGGVGAGIGALLPAGRATIYRAERRAAP
jgi:hypothetical protein